jgi:MFS family permease
VRQVADESSSLFTPAFIALTLSDLAYFTAQGLMIFVTPFFVTGPLASAEGTVGLVMGSFSISTLLLRPLVGRLADRHGRRRLLVGGAMAFGVIVALHATATHVAVLVLLRLLLGAAEAFFFVAGFATLADLAPPEREGEALSFNSLALFLGLAIGPLIGDALLAVGGFGLAWLGGAVLALIAVALAARVPETGDSGAVTEPIPLFHRTAIGPGLMLFAGVAAMAVFLAYAPLHGAALGLDTTSTVLLVFGVVVVTLRLTFAKLPDRVPPRQLIPGALAASAVGLGLAATGGGPGLLAAAALSGVGVAFLTPSVFVAIFSIVPPAERGAAAATTSIFIDLGFGGGPLLAGLVVAGADIPMGFAVAALAAVLAAVLSLLTLPARPVPVG